MNHAVRILHLEESDHDASWIERHLKTAGLTISMQRAKTADRFADALQRDAWDLILADCTAPGFDLQQALRLLQTRGLDIPVLIVSSRIGEATAVQAVKAGARDYVLKDDPARLAPAVERELREAADRHERKRAEARRAQLEAELRQTQKAEAIGALAGGIAHDFNNVLAAILGHAELLQADLEPEHPGHESLSEILAASRRARDLVQQILAFSRGRERGRQPVLLAPVVREALALLRATLPATIEIQAELPAPGPTVLADPAQIHQLIVNLGANFAQAMREHGGRMEANLVTVAIGADLARRPARLLPGCYARLSLGYLGRGPGGTSLERLLDPFPAAANAGDGTPLGFSIVLGIMETHDGVITIQSQPGEGTTCHLHFPTVEARPAMETAAAPKLPRGQNERILVVDDEEAIARLAVTALERLGYSVTAVTSPGEALAIVRADPRAVDLVLTDFTMPQMLGTELARQLRQQRSELPILLASGYSDTIEPGQARLAGILEVVAKPFDQQVLAEAVRRALHNARTGNRQTA